MISGFVLLVVVAGCAAAWIGCCTRPARWRERRTRGLREAQKAMR